MSFDAFQTRLDQSDSPFAQALRKLREQDLGALQSDDLGTLIVPWNPWD
ncbi:MAG: hypothetical protein AAGN46_07515 [Acidobacteriota bacterium]